MNNLEALTISFAMGFGIASIFWIIILERSNIKERGENAKN